MLLFILKFLISVIYSLWQIHCSWNHNVSKSKWLLSLHSRVSKHCNICINVQNFDKKNKILIPPFIWSFKMFMLLFIFCVILFIIISLIFNKMIIWIPLHIVKMILKTIISNKIMIIFRLTLINILVGGKIGLLLNWILP